MKRKFTPDGLKIFHPLVNVLYFVANHILKVRNGINITIIATLIYFTYLQLKENCQCSHPFNPFIGASIERSEPLCNLDLKPRYINSLDYDPWPGQNESQLAQTMATSKIRSQSRCDNRWTNTLAEMGELGKKQYHTNSMQGHCAIICRWIFQTKIWQ